MGSWHSGTRLVCQILESSMPVLSQSNSMDFNTEESVELMFKLVNNKFSKKHRKKFISILEHHTKKMGIENNFVCKMPIFSFLGEFLRFSFENSPIINIIRNGLDVAVSDLALRLPTKDDNFKEKARAYIYFGGWIPKAFGVDLSTLDPMERKRPKNKHLFAAQLWKRTTMRSIFNRKLPLYYEIRYEDLILNPKQVAVNLLDHFNLEYNAEKLDSVLNSFDKTKVNRWKKSFRQFEVRDMMKIIKNEMKYLGYI